MSVDLLVLMSTWRENEKGKKTQKIDFQPG